jgi:hypothetical protein
MNRDAGRTGHWLQRSVFAPLFLRPQRSNVRPLARALK